MMFARVEEEIQRNVIDGSAKIKQHVDSILFAKVSWLAEPILSGYILVLVKFCVDSREFQVSCVQSRSFHLREYILNMELV